jgi:aminoglycoside phosphotransferase (APT) family kinase protein
VGLWRAYADREVAGRYHPVLDAGFAWLDRHPPAPAKPGFCWGDSRPGNMIWQDFRCACVTDFEAACIAPPEVDLGWWLMFDRWVHEAQGVERLPGEPTRHEQRGVYRAAGGAASCDPADLDFYEVFAAVRYTAIVVRAMNRMGERGIMPSDQIFWRDNPSTTCLEQMLAEF